MHVSISAVKNDRQCIAVELDQSEVENYLQNFYLSVAATRGIHPQAGASSKELVEAAIGIDELGQLASQMVFSRALPLALDKAGVEFVGQPQCTYDIPAAPDRPFAMRVTGVPAPIIELTSYDPISLEQVQSNVSESEIDAFIERVAYYHPDSVADFDADVVTPVSYLSLGMETTSEGERFDSLCFGAKEYRVSSGDMPDGFDEHILGMKAGESRTFSFSAPSSERDGDGHLISRSYETTVTLNGFLKQVRPVIDDAWVKRNISGCADLASFRAKIAAELKEQADAEGEAYLKYAAADAISRRLAKPVSDAAFEACYNEMLADFRKYLSDENKTEGDYLREQQMTLDQLKARLMDQTRNQLRQTAALDAVARHNNMKLTDAEFSQYLDDISEGQGEELGKNLRKNGGLEKAKQTALRFKVNDWLVETAIES